MPVNRTNTYKYEDLSDAYWVQVSLKSNQNEEMVTILVNNGIGASLSHKLIDS